MERRKFLRSSCNACMYLAAGLILPGLSGCGPGTFPVMQAEISHGEVSVPLTAFDKSPLQLVRPKGWYYAIAVRKKEDQTYSALLLKCTHQDNPLTASRGGYSCNLHGSTFYPDGRVARGPAERTLKTYPVTIGQGQLTIQLKS
ncbi:MAG: Rieske (2Fe-2S) protein [Bacteroidota bacterium]|nr:Rieske (2Fe-2S) protein [Bacteroidota bacterium]